MVEIDKMSNKELNQLSVELIFSFRGVLVKKMFYIYEFLRVKKNSPIKYWNPKIHLS